MEFQDVLLDVEDIRRRVQCRDSAPNFKYKQGYFIGGKFKYYRHRTVELELYPDNNRHMQILRDLEAYGFNYAGILHDSDLLEKKVDVDSDDVNEVGGDDSFEDILGLAADDVQDDNSNDDEVVVNSSILSDSEIQIAEKEILSEGDTFDSNQQIVEDEIMTYDGVHKKPHFHIVIYFTNARTNTAVAKALNHDSNLTWVYANLNARLLYLTHRDYVLKYQYSPNKVFGPLSCRMPQLHTEYGRRSSDLLGDVLDKISKVSQYSQIRFTQFARDMLKSGYDSLLTSKYLGIIKECIFEHNNYARWLNEHKWDDAKRYDVPFTEI